MKRAIALLLMAAPALAAAGPWTNVCESDPANLFCADVGKMAHSARGAKIVRDIELGKIVGVAFKLKGGLISQPGSDYPRLSPRDGYYYIVGAGGVVDYDALHDVRSIKPR